MSFYHLPILEESTGLVPMLSVAGSKDSASEPNRASPAVKPLMKNTFPSDQAANQARSFTSGIAKELPPFSTGWVMNGPFTIRSNGNIGQEILDINGQIICRTTDIILAHLIAKLLGENE